MIDAPPDVGKVVDLFGNAVAVEGDPNVVGAVVSVLEALLADARAGKITSIAACYLSPDPTDQAELNMSSWAADRRIQLLGCLTRATYALNRNLDYTDKGECGRVE